MVSKISEKEFNYYIDHQEELVKGYDGKVIVLKDNKVIGVFDNDLDAVTEISKTHKIGTFFVHKCGTGEENYTQTFYSPYVSIV